VNAGSAAAGFFMPPKSKASSLACVASVTPARCTGDGGGVGAISAHSFRRGGGGVGRDARGDAACIFARAITASQSSSSSAGAACDRKRAATLVREFMLSSSQGAAFPYVMKEEPDS
jgi:hypothetical protein